MAKAERQLAVIDIDGTVLPGGVGIFAVAANLAEVGLMNPTGTERMQQDLQKHKDGILEYEDYATEVLTHLAEGLAGQRQDQVSSQADRFLLRKSDIFYPYALRLIPRLNQTHDTYFITANAQFYAEFFTKHFGTSEYRATMLKTSNGIFTGEVEKYLTRAVDKEKEVATLLKRYPYNGSIALGDAEGDKIILGMVEHPICINPTAGLKSLALQNNWIVTDHLEAEVVINRRLGLR